MKRDDFGMRIDNVRELATKYSKPELARMVQMGMVSPQEALMAGMMIDRIAKSAMQPPQTTVAEDVLAAPTTAQGQIPPGIMGAPQAPAPSPGVAGLPSGMENMAGGGIVAFAEGGDTDDIPGFAGEKGSYIDPDMFKAVIAAESKGKANAVSPKGARGLAQLMPGTARDPGYGVRGVRDESPEENVRVGNEYLNAMLKKYGNIDYALAAYNWGPGNVDKWIARGAKPEELPAETRNYIPKVKAGLAQIQNKVAMPGKDALSGLEGLIQSAQAAEAPAMSRAPAAPAPTGDQRPKTARERLFEQQVMEEYGLGPQKLTPEQQRASQESAQRALDYQAKQKQLQQIEGGMFSQKPLTEQEASEAQRIRSEMQGIQAKPPVSVSPASAAPAAPSKFQVEEAPPPRAEEPVARAPGFERPGKIEAEQLAMPQERTAKELYKEMEEMYGEAGVNTNLYREMMQELREKKAGMKDRKEQALGLALMSFGIDLAGARKGQEFDRLGMAGQRALGMYVNSMDKIVENEDKIEALQRQVRLAENNYKRTGADSALALRDRLLARADNIAAKNAELKQDAAKSNAQIGAELFKSDVYFQARTQDTAARIAAALGANRGGYTEPQLSKLISDIEMQYGPELREKNKHLGSKEQIEKAVQEELDKLVIEHVNKVKGIRQKGGIPVPSSGAAPWQVQSGVD